MSNTKLHPVRAASGGVVHVTNDAVDSVTPIDIATNRPRPAILTGGEPYGIAFADDGATAWVVNREDNDLVPIDLATGRLGAPILDPYGPLTVAPQPLAR